MYQLIYEKKTGFVVAAMQRDTAPEVMAHHKVIAHPTKPDFNAVKIVDGKVTDYASAEYIASLKARIKAAINDAREAKLAEGMTTPHGVVQADVASRTNINSAVNRASSDLVGFAIDWRMKDNKSVKLNAAKMIAVGQSLATFVSTVYEKSFTLKAQVDAMTTVAELRGFVIDFG